MKQKGKSVEGFEKAIEELFVDLTIAQADGNSANYQVFKNVNEKQAIRSFADGLRDHEMGTLVKARNFVSLKDAIRSAMDEERPQRDGDERVFHFNHGGRCSHRGRSNFRQMGHGTRLNNNDSRYRGQGHGTVSRGRSSYNNYSSNIRGNTIQPRTRFRGRPYRYVNYAGAEKAETADIANENPPKEKTFFREY